METVDDERDGLTGTPVRSLYGNTAATLRPRSEDLRGIDVDNLTPMDALLTLKQLKDRLNEGK